MKHSSPTSKGMHKTDLFSAEQIMTLTLCYSTDQPKYFYWLVVRMHFNTFCVLCMVKANEQI